MSVRTYLALARVSNLPTVWTNVLAGVTLTYVGRDFSPATVAVAAVGVSLLYCAGMVFNDVADVEEDAIERPTRPIPSGRVTRSSAALFGGLLVVAGVAALFLESRDGEVTTITVAALLTAILYYDLRHKQDPLGPLVMGICRGLVYCVAAATAAALTVPVLVGAAVMTAYVTLLTLVAKYGGARYGWSIKWLIAGICIVDALVIGGTGRWDLALVAAAGFPLTLAAQRVVSGT